MFDKKNICNHIRGSDLTGDRMPQLGNKRVLQFGLFCKGGTYTVKIWYCWHSWLVLSFNGDATVYIAYESHHCSPISSYLGCASLCAIEKLQLSNISHSNLVHRPLLHVSLLRGRLLVLTFQLVTTEKASNCKSKTLIEHAKCFNHWSVPVYYTLGLCEFFSGLA